MAATLALAGVACAAYPERPVRWVLGFAAGGSPDAVARAVSQQLSAQLGQPVVLDNRPGANGIVGSDVVARASPDGYTLLVTPASFAFNPSVYRRLPFDPVKSFTPITNLCISPGLLLVVHASFPAQSVQQLVELGKKPGSRLAFGSSGTGNASHLAGALFNARTGAGLVHVPYRGGGLVTTALLSNEVQATFTNPATVVSQIKAGRLRALAYNGGSRAQLLPDVPTMIEAGVSGMEMDPSWYGVFAPAHTPALVVNTLHAEIRRTVWNPAVRERLAALGTEPVGDTPAQFTSFVQRAITRAAELTRVAGIDPE